jgi:hypothetical protein
MEQRTMSHFFTLKGLKARTIRTELESVIAQKRLLSRQGRSAGNAFTKGQRVCLTISGPEGL